MVDGPEEAQLQVIELHCQQATSNQLKLDDHLILAAGTLVQIYMPQEEEEQEGEEPAAVALSQPASLYAISQAHIARQIA